MNLLTTDIEWHVPANINTHIRFANRTEKWIVDKTLTSH